MGKVLKTQIIKLWAAIGNYAFPEGRPALDFSGGTAGLTAEITTDFGTHVTPYAGDSEVDLGDSLTIQLSTTDDMYVIDPSSVKVIMGGVDVASSFYNQNTDIITIPSVLDDVSIEAAAMTYIQDNLVLHLDGRHRGGTGSAVAGHWKSRVNYGSSPIDFTLTSCDESHADYVGFDGQNSKGIGSVSLLDVAAATGSIESVYGGVELNSQACVIMHNALGSGSRICMSTGHGSLATGVNMLTMTGALNGNSAPSNATYEGILQTDFLASHYLSFVQGAFLVEGASKTPAASIAQASNANSMLSLFYRKTTNEMFFKGNLYALRVYSDKLTQAEQLQNYIVDKKRFNL